MLVSVIVPLFNHEPFVFDCLLSLFAQTWSDLELIVIDDVSRDRSFQIAQIFARNSWIAGRFKRLVVEQNEVNLGAAATINKAVSLSSGQVCMVVNSDDFYAPRRAECCVEAIARGSELVFTDVEFVGADGQPVLTREALAFRSALDAISSYPSVSASFLPMNRAISTGNLCFTRRLYDAAGPFRNLDYCHDWDFALACTLETEPAFIEEKLYSYRLHGGNSFRALASRVEPESRSCLERYFNRIVCHSVGNPVLRAIAGCEELWEGLVASGGPVVVDEWQRAREGRPPRALPEDLTGKEAVLPNKPQNGGLEEHPGLSSWASVLEMLSERVCDPLLAVGHRGEIYSDGWIGRSAELRLCLPQGIGHLAATFFVPPDMESKTLISNITSGERPLYRSVTRIEPGQTAEVLFQSLPAEQGRMNIQLAIVGCERQWTGPRDLGVELLEMRPVPA